jgi:hypothetical protein
LRKLLLLTFSFGLFTFCFAQGKYGIKGGMTQSFVTETPIITGADNTLQTGFQIGLFLEKTITTNLTFRPSLQLTQKGYQSVVGNPGGPFYWSRNLTNTYLEIPFDILRKFAINKASIFYVGTGPVVSYGLRGRLKAAVVSTDNNQQLHTQISTDNNIFKNNLDRRFDFGWDFNIGVQSCKMLFNASYNHGITNVVKGDNQSLKNRSFAFSVGYLLR